jgi:hypothetical protein
VNRTLLSRYFERTFYCLLSADFNHSLVAPDCAGVSHEAVFAALGKNRFQLSIVVGASRESIRTGHRELPRPCRDPSAGPIRIFEPPNALAVICWRAPNCPLKVVPTPTCRQHTAPGRKRIGTMISCRQLEAHAPSGIKQKRTATGSKALLTDTILSFSRTNKPEVRT